MAAQLGREAARQLDDVIKRREDVRLKTADKKWREYARSEPKYFVKYLAALDLERWRKHQCSLIFRPDRLQRAQRQGNK